MPAWDETGFGVPGPKPYELHWSEEEIIKLKDDIDRLRAENQAYIDGRLVMDTKQELVSEIDRLRHDIERMQEIDSQHLAEIDALDRSHKDLAHKLADAGREINRLRTELADMPTLKTCESMDKENDRLLADIDRLRAEIVQFKHALEMQQHTEMGLRAENADLAGMLKLYFHAHETGNSLPPYIVTQARSTLAKTAKADAAAQNDDLFRDETLRTPDRP